MSRSSDNTYLNKNLYATKLFKIWSEKKDLIPLETYFIEKYLSNKNGKIIEAGVGGGRISFKLENLGYHSIEAFDYVDNMIAFCNKKKTTLNSGINFKIADATNLFEYESKSFDYLIYLQQVLCFLDETNFIKALNEAYRIGKDDATYIFSVLNWNIKVYNPVLSAIVNLFRFLRLEKTNKYKLPWLNIDGKFNWKFLNKNQPQNVWFKEKHILDILKKHGFFIVEVKSQMTTYNKFGHIHIACKKRKLN